jgi:hypothetical protein
VGQTLVSHSLQDVEERLEGLSLMACRAMLLHDSAWEEASLSREDQDRQEHRLERETRREDRLEFERWKKQRLESMTSEDEDSE